jgi:hypothetical protein
MTHRRYGLPPVAAWGRGGRGGRGGAGGAVTGDGAAVKRPGCLLYVPRGREAIGRWRGMAGGGGAP